MTVHSKSSRSACACSARCSRVFFRFSSSGRIKNADFHPVHWEISSFCSFRHARHLLPEKCQLSEWKPQSPGAARDRSHHRPPSLETPDAFLNLRRDDLLYAASVCILRYLWIMEFLRSPNIQIISYLFSIESMKHFPCSISQIIKRTSIFPTQISFLFMKL